MHPNGLQVNATVADMITTAAAEQGTQIVHIAAEQGTHALRDVLFRDNGEYIIVWRYAIATKREFHATAWLARDNTLVDDLPALLTIDREHDLTKKGAKRVRAALFPDKRFSQIEIDALYMVRSATSTR
jgi:hypothetical protein